MQGLVEGLFAGVAEGWVADVVGECEGFSELLVQAKGSGDGAGDLGDFESVREAAAEVVTRKIACEAGEDLCFSGEAAEGACVQNAGAVAGEGGPVRVVGFRILARGQLSQAADGDIWGQKEVVRWLVRSSRFVFASPWFGYNAGRALERTQREAADLFRKVPTTC